MICARKRSTLEYLAEIEVG